MPKPHILYGFNSNVWPLFKDEDELLSKFAKMNEFNVVVMNASIMLYDDASQHDNNAIQVTLYDDDPSMYPVNMLHEFCIYPYVVIDVLDTAHSIDFNGYAASFTDYLKLCSQENSVFCKVSNSQLHELKKIDYAENILIAHDMTSSAFN